MGQWQYVDAKEIVSHHEGHQDGEHRNHGVEHHNRAWLIEIVAPEECQIDGEEDDHNAHIDNLSKHSRCYFIL